MDSRYYLMNNKPELVPFMDLVGSMTKGECGQFDLERIIRLDIDKTTNIQNVQIKRVI